MIHKKNNKKIMQITFDLSGATMENVQVENFMEVNIRLEKTNGKLQHIWFDLIQTKDPMIINEVKEWLKQSEPIEA